MARSSGDTLGLGELGYATGHNANVSTQTSLNQANGSAGTTVSLDDFGIDAAGSITAEDDTPDEGSTMAVTLGFTTAGSKFLSKIGNQTRNFAWGHTGASGNGSYASADYSAQWTAPSVTSNTSATLNCEFNDFFNAHATNYGSTITKAVTIQETGGGGTGGGGSCFIAGTEILMSDNTWKRIETITLDDVVKSVQIPTLPDADEYVVYATWQATTLDNMVSSSAEVVLNQGDYYYDHYEIIDAENNVIKATHEHPLLIQRYHDEVDVDGTSRMIYRWARVRELLASDKLITIDGTPITIHSIRKVVGEDIFYSLNVEVTDSYIVRWGDKMVIAHNETGK